MHRGVSRVCQSSLWSRVCAQERQLGQRLNIIIVAEGAIDQDGKIITPDYVKDVSDQY